MHKLKMSWFLSLDAKTQRRLRATAFATANYLINVVVLFGYAAADIIPYRVALIILIVGVTVNAAFLWGIASGMTQRFREPALAQWQVFAACGLNFLGLVLAPQIAYMFIVNMFVPLSYTSLVFRQNMFLSGWILLSVALGVTILIVGPNITIVLSTPVERTFFWLVITLALGRCLLVNWEVARLQSKMQADNKGLAKETVKLADLTSRDALTGLWNQREFKRLMQEESRRAVRSRSGFCVAILCVDDFKKINDRFGRKVSDAALKEVAQILEIKRRATDSIARYNGEQFTLLLVTTKLGSATVALERIRHDIARFNWESIAADLHLTVSAGVAGWQPGETIHQLFRRAEATLQEAKTAGNNCVRIALS